MKRPVGQYKGDRCLNGHLYDDYVHSDGKRRCRTCLRANRKAYRQRQAAKRQQP